MSTAELLIVCLCLGLAWYSWGQLQRSRRRRRRRLAARRRRFDAFFDSQEQELSGVTIVLVSNVFRSTLQRRSIWTRTRSQAFADIIDRRIEGFGVQTKFPCEQRNISIFVHFTAIPFAAHQLTSGSDHGKEESCHSIVEAGNK